MGTDFSYEDLGMDYQSEDYQKSVFQETDTQYLIEVIPIGEDFNYSKFLLYIDKDIYNMQKVEFYNLEGNLNKMLEIKKIEIDDNNKITPMEIEITNTLDNHKTILNIKEIEYDMKLASDFFSIRTMQKPKL